MVAGDLERLPTMLSLDTLVRTLAAASRLESVSVSVAIGVAWVVWMEHIEVMHYVNAREKHAVHRGGLCSSRSK